MNAIHAIKSTARCALLSLPIFAALGCVGADDGSIADDSADVSPHGVMKIRDDASASHEIPAAGEAAASNDAPVADLPSVDTHATAASQSVNSGHGINYHNGSIMSGHVKIYYILYGAFSGTDMTILDNFANDIGGSPNYNINALYDDSSGNSVTNFVSVGGSAVDLYSQGHTLDDGKVFTIVKTAIGNGQLPLDSNGVYFVLTASDVTESSGFCTKYCGWHTYGTYNNTTLKYSFVGNPSALCPSSCEYQTSKSPNGSPGADGMVSVMAHELEEATTDPQLNAWYDSSGNESADKCAWTFGSTFTSSNGATANMMLNGHEYLIQQQWLNSGSGSCALTYGQLGAHGGGGGNRFDVACEPGDVAVGLAGRSGSLVDKVGLICATVSSDGSLSSSTYTTAQYGGGGGSAYSVQCPSGEAIVGLSGRSGSDVDQLDIKCSTLSNWKSSGTVQYTALVGGGNGGSAFDESCVQGHVLNRITGRSGSLVDQAQGGCAKVWPY